MGLIGQGLPSKRAGLLRLLSGLRVVGNVDGAAAGEPITVPGLQPHYPILWVQAGDATNLSGATIQPAAGSMRLDIDTASKKLNVAYFDPSAIAVPQSTGAGAIDIAPVHGALDAILPKLRISNIAGANGNLTLSGVTADDVLISAWVHDATINLGNENLTFIPADQLIGSTVDTSSKRVHVLWYDADASNQNTVDINSALPIPRSGEFNRFVRGLRLIRFQGPNGAANVTVAPLNNLAAADNVLAVWPHGSGAPDHTDGAWTIASGGGGLNYAGAANLSTQDLYALVWHAALETVFAGEGGLPD